MNTALSSKDLESVLLEKREILQSIWQVMRVQLIEVGLQDNLNTLPRPELAQYSLRIDPFDSSETLFGIWRDQHGNQTGEIQVHSSGRVYAEADVVRNHPKDGRWFVEAVTAWGNSDDIKTELRLLPAL